VSPIAIATSRSGILGIGSRPVVATVAASSAAPADYPQLGRVALGTREPTRRKDSGFINPEYIIKTDDG
jgi:hypothetical protein